MYLVKTIDEGKVIKTFKHIESAENYCDIHGWQYDGKRLCVTYKEVN